MVEALPVNIGGVGNITYVGTDGSLIAFDTGPGNALINDWIKKHYSRDFDENGMVARQGAIDEELLQSWLALPYFNRKPPKSLDRDEWRLRSLAAGECDFAYRTSRFKRADMNRFVVCEVLNLPPTGWPHA